MKTGFGELHNEAMNSAMGTTWAPAKWPILALMQ